MTVEQQVQRFINSPYPLWEKETTKAVVAHKWRQLESVGITKDLYNTPTVFNKSISIIRKTEDFLFLGPDKIYIEYPSADLSEFYEDNGLNLYTEAEIGKHNAVAKIKNSISLLNLVPGVYECISIIVRSIQILRSDDPEIDVSYSHPDIPFTIFVSICEDDSRDAILRVAEAILHESMHLKLTLIENVTKLSEEGTGNLFYSPWREELRPAQGILHGIFVFKSVLDFFKMILKIQSEGTSHKYIKKRIMELEEELSSLKNFAVNQDLTDAGKNLMNFILC